MEERHHSYVIKTVEEIGRGGFGFVEKVEIFNIDGVRCGFYAKKILSPSDGLSKDEFRRRFKREVDYQAKCSHFNVAPIYFHNLNVENPWFVMDLAEGDLSDELAKGQLSVTQKFDIALMVLAGVNYMHEERMLSTGRKPSYWHRDLKPSNILKFGDGNYKISDFGLVKNAGKDGESEILTKVATAMGTAKYMAPEITSAGLYSPQTDVFALGVIIDDLEIPGLKRVIEKCTAWKPTSRYQTVEEIIHDLGEIRGKEGL